MLAVALAFQFLTTIPIPVWRKPSVSELGQAQRYFPLVGATVGLLLVGGDLLFGSVLPTLVVGALLIALQTGITGALHLDGFADCCDALLGPKEVERRLEILRDSRIGSYGSAGLICLLLVKYAALVSLAGPWRWGGLVAMPTLGRWSMVYALTSFPYARPAGAGSAFKQSASRGSLAIASLCTAALVGVSLGFWGLAAMGLTWVIAWGLGRLTLTRIPGLTGDAYGAINEVVEAAVLLLVVALGTRGLL